MSAPQEKRKVILAAAMSQFSQYGFRKTSMEDIAQAAGISRPSLYSYFENKEEIFRSLSQALNEEALKNAKGALKPGCHNSSIEHRVERALLAFNVSLFRLLDESPHGAELMDESNRLGGEITQSSYQAFAAMLTKEIQAGVEQGDLNLDRTGITAAEAADVIRYSVVGLKGGSGNADDYQKRVQNLIRVYFAGLS